MDFSCPKCHGALSMRQSSFVCPNGHSFDRARKGYTNLLLGVGGGTHGDNKEMLDARRAFLNTDRYLPLANRLCHFALKYIKPRAAVLDIGCGEGYYTDKLECALSARDTKSRVSAFDISKDAVSYVWSRNKNIECAVASAYNIPASDATFDAAINAFSPLALEETRRVLVSGGIFIVAFPGEEHLFGLKAAIYDTPYKNEPMPLSLDGFDLIESERVRYEMELSSSEEISALFKMTPYAYRTKKENKDRVFALRELKTEADFYICVYKKK